MNRRGAIIVMSVFAAIWWTVGVVSSGRGSALLDAAGILISALMVALSWRDTGLSSTTVAERRRRGRAVGIASAIEGALIVLAVIMLTRLGRRELIAPAVAIIVGLHFLPLAYWLAAPIYYLTAGLLVVVGLSGSGVPDLPTRVFTVGVGAAVALWLSCGVVVLRARIQRELP